MNDDPRYPEERGMKAQGVLRRLSEWILVACGIWLFGLAGYVAGMSAEHAIAAAPKCAVDEPS